MGVCQKHQDSGLDSDSDMAGRAGLVLRLIGQRQTHRSTTGEGQNQESVQPGQTVPKQTEAKFRRVIIYQS